MTDEISVGKDVLSYCGKCKLVLAHVIVTMAKPKKIGKCECNTCHAKHNYRDPEALNKPSKRKVGSRSKAKATLPVDELWKEALSKTDRTSQPYSMESGFSEGDVIDHPVFGKGLVEQIVEGKKMKILFEKGVKLLIHNQKNEMF